MSSRLSQSIFVLDDKHSNILFDYIDFCFLDINKYNISYTQSLLNLLCCSVDNSESVLPFSPKDMFFKDALTQWVYDLSLSYIRMSGIDCHKLRLYLIECIRSSEQIVIENSKAATVVFHFNKRNNGYVTTHKNNLSHTSEDEKCIVVVFERL